MGLFDDIKNSFNKAGKDLSNSLNSYSESADLALKTNGAKSTIEDKYKEIGKKYYEANKDNAPEEYAELFKVIEENKKLIEENEKRQEELKKERDTGNKSENQQENKEKSNE